MTTGETLGSVFPITVEFVRGEQPSNEKFTGWAAQTDAGLEQVAKAVGDIWSEQFATNSLFVASHRPQHIMNLARLIGPASALNPMRPVTPASRVEYNVTLDANDKTININEFNLRDLCNCEPPIDWTGSFPNGVPIVHTSIQRHLMVLIVRFLLHM